MTLSILLQVIFMVFFPAFLLWLIKKVPFLDWLGPIVLCYATGMLIANLPFIHIYDQVSTNVMKIAVPLAIGLLLLPTDFVHWLRYAGKTMLSFGLCIVAITISSITVTYLFAENLPNADKLAGMVIGVYTGGTPNMSAIGMSLGVDNEVFILLNSADIAIGGLYLLFLMSICQRLLLQFLPEFKKEGVTNTPSEEDSVAARIDMLSILREYGVPLGLSVLMLGGAVGLSLLIQGEIKEVIVILTITSFGIAASFIKKVRKLKGSFPIGEYLLMMFCIAIGSLADFSELIQASGTIFSFMASVVLTAIALHFLLAALFRIDADTVMITSTAGFYGPAFVPVIAKTLKNDEVIVSGLTTGLVGYALANYLGIAVYYLLS